MRLLRGTVWRSFAGGDVDPKGLEDPRIVTDVSTKSIAGSVFQGWP